MPTGPVLVYDGDCGFCTTAALFAAHRLLGHGRHAAAEITAWQFADLDLLGVTPGRASYEVLWVTPAGTVHGGAQAVARILLGAGGCWPVLGALLVLPPFRWIAHGVYRLVAANRDRMPGGTPACAAPAGDARPGRKPPAAG